jgi:hypothetical protein
MNVLKPMILETMISDLWIIFKTRIYVFYVSWIFWWCWLCVWGWLVDWFNILDEVRDMKWCDLWYVCLCANVQIDIKSKLFNLMQSTIITDTDAIEEVILAQQFKAIRQSWLTKHRQPRVYIYWIRPGNLTQLKEFSLI